MKIFNTIISLCVFVWIVLNVFVLKAAYDVGTFWPMLIYTLSGIGIGMGITLLIFSPEWEKQNKAFYNISDIALDLAADRDHWKEMYGQYGPPTG